MFYKLPVFSWSEFLFFSFSQLLKSTFISHLLQTMEDFMVINSNWILQCRCPAPSLPIFLLSTWCSEVSAHLIIIKLWSLPFSVKNNQTTQHSLLTSFILRLREIHFWKHGCFLCILLMFYFFCKSPGTIWCQVHAMLSIYWFPDKFFLYKFIL